MDLRARRRVAGGAAQRLEPCFEGDALGLVPVAVDTWGPFVSALADGRLLGEPEALIAAFQAYVRERVEPPLDA